MNGQQHCCKYSYFIASLAIWKVFKSFFVLDKHIDFYVFDAYRLKFFLVHTYFYTINVVLIFAFIYTLKSGYFERSNVVNSGQHSHLFAFTWYLSLSVLLPIFLFITVTTLAFAFFVSLGDRFELYCGYLVYLTGFTFPVSPFLVTVVVWKQKQNYESNNSNNAK